MKRGLNIASVFAAILGVVIISAVLNKRQEPGSKLTAVAFAGFPVNEPRYVDIAASDETVFQLSSREYSDQIKDWLLTTVVSDAGLSPAELNQSLFDLPPVRYAYLRPVGSFDYGDTRSRSVGNGRVVALIPKSDPVGRLDALARIADEARKDTGNKPTTVLVFEYEVSPDNLSAEITRRADVDGGSLFTETSGYVETTVGSLEDLRSFMSRIDDLTYARLDVAGLRLGGRKVPSHHHHDITLDDAAALWSAQTKLRTKSDEFRQFVEGKEQELNSRWSGRTYRTEYERLRLESEHAADIAQVKADIDRQRERMGVVEHTGFSLDPSFVYAKVQAALRGRLGEAMLEEAHGKFSPFDLQQAAEQAGDGKLEAFYSLLQKLDPDIARPMILWLKATCSYQAARYDGTLQGTEVGMVLFYTDLLAKLWALDFMNSAPDNYIPEFHSMSHMVLSPIYGREMEVLPSTRLWFGVQPRGFALKDEGAPAIILAPVATRLYAASSDAITPGKEVPPNPASAAFLGWWDDHYAEVARFEPEYERLNEIMKWSLVISWLDDKGQLERLSPLEKVNVKSDNWFPEWVSAHPDLRFQNWDRIHFYPRGFAKTEALPLLQSDAKLPMPLIGGVSLAEKEVIEARGVISEEVAEIGRRPTLKWSESTPDIFRTVEGAEYRFAQSAESYTMDASLKGGTKFRAMEEEVADLHYTRSIGFEHSTVRIEAKDSGAAIGDLRIERAANSFRVSWQSREVDAATALARKVSTSADPAYALASDSRVAASVKTGDHEFLVQLSGSEKWLKLAAEPQPSANIAEGWQSRVAPVDPDARSIDLAWYSKDRAAEELGGAKYIRISSVSSEADGVRLQIAARPPPGAVDTNVSLSGRELRAQRDSATGDYYVRWPELAQEVREHPELLRGVARSGGSGDVPRSFDELAAGDFRRAARDLAGDPLLFKAALEQHYLSGLKEADTLLANGEDAKALRALDDLSNVHGNTPEIELRKAIALTRSGSPDRVVRAVNGTLKAPIHDRTALFDEINTRIRNAQSSTERDDLAQLAAFGDWNDMRTTGALRDGVPVANVEKGRLQIDYHALGDLKGARVPDVPSRGAPIYVQDTPGLSNLDSPAAIQQALHSGIQGKVPAVIRIDQDELAFFRPAKIYMPDGKTSLRNVESSLRSDSDVAGQTYRAYSISHCSAEDNRAECRNQRQPVYLVMDSHDAAQVN
jgi:hypothetical protein